MTMSPQEAFLNVLVAAMKDAAQEKKLCQIQSTMDDGKGGTKIVRIIIIPEEMEYRFPKDQPLGTNPKRN